MTITQTRLPVPSMRPVPFNPTEVPQDEEKWGAGRGVKMSGPIHNTPRHHHGSFNLKGASSGIRGGLLEGFQYYHVRDRESKPKYMNVEFMTNQDRTSNNLSKQAATKPSQHDQFLQQLGRSWDNMGVVPRRAPPPASSDLHTQRINQGSDGETNMIASVRDSGMREDGRLSNVQGLTHGPSSTTDTRGGVRSMGAGSAGHNMAGGTNFTVPTSHSAKDWELHLTDPAQLQRERALLASHKKGVPVQVDDLVKAMQTPDNSSDPNEANMASVRENEQGDRTRELRHHHDNKGHNRHYDPKKQHHPSDAKGKKLNDLSSKHKMRKLLDETLELQNIKLSERKDFLEDRRRYNDSRITEDRRRFDAQFDRNQVMVDNERTPININVSCNQSKAPWWARTPDRYHRQFDSGWDGVDSDRCYGNSLRYWYGHNENGNNVYLAGRRWRRGAGTGSPSVTDSMFYPRKHRRWQDPPGRWLDERKDPRPGQVIGAPFAKYTNYGHVQHTDQEFFRNKTPHVNNMSDPAKVSFNKISFHRQ